MNAAPARLVDRVDPELFAEIDERCIQVDRLLCQLGDTLRSALVLAAAHRDSRLTSELRVALRCADDLTQEGGQLGLALLDLRDTLTPEAGR